MYITAALAAVFFTAAWITGATNWLALAVTAAGFTYYNLPFLETGRPTIGANQYGIFIQAFGLIRWRAIERIELVQIAERAMTVHELQICLGTHLSRSALVADWRKAANAIARYASARGTWTHNNRVRVNIEPLTNRPMKSTRTSPSECGATTGARSRRGWFFSSMT